jgi:hypothetical protein
MRLGPRVAASLAACASHARFVAPLCDAQLPTQPVHHICQRCRLRCRHLYNNHPAFCPAGALLTERPVTPPASSAWMRLPYSGGSRSRDSLCALAPATTLGPVHKSRSGVPLAGMPLSNATCSASSMMRPEYLSAQGRGCLVDPLPVFCTYTPLLETNNRCFGLLAMLFEPGSGCFSGLAHTPLDNPLRHARSRQRYRRRSRSVQWAIAPGIAH